MSEPEQPEEYFLKGGGGFKGTKEATKFSFAGMCDMAASYAEYRVADAESRMENRMKAVPPAAETAAPKPRIFLDMDGVVVDFESYKNALSLTGDEVKKRPGAYLNMKPYPEAVKAIKWLIGSGYAVWLATKPPTGIAFAYADKADWVFRNLPELRRKLIITHDKGLLGDTCDFLVDDRPHKANCERFKGTLIPFINGETWDSVIAKIRAAETANLCPECGHPKSGDGHGNCAIEGCNCEYSIPIRSSGSSAETAMTAEQDIQQVLDFYNNWHDHSDDFTPDRDTIGLVLAYAAHVREAAQERYDRNLRDRDRVIEQWRTRAETVERKLAELKKAASALHDKLKIILPKVDAIIGCQSMRTGMQVYDGPNIKEEMKLLASLRAESKEG